MIRGWGIRLTAGVNDIGYPEQGEGRLGADVVNRPNVGRHHRKGVNA